MLSVTRFVKRVKTAASTRGLSAGEAMENPGVLNILKYANAVKLKWYSQSSGNQVWIRADLKHMDDINGANTVDIADMSRGSGLLELLVEILTSPDTDWMKYDSPGEEEWYVLPSLMDT